MNSKEMYQKFINRFHVGDTPKPCSQTDVDEYQSKLSTVLPASFVFFMTNFGPLFCDMLDPIVEGELDLWDIQNIPELSESVESTIMYWSGGMPDDYVVFGNDSMGNAFCFLRSQKKGNDSSVYLFDHDFGEMDKLSESFDQWIMSYLEEIPEN